VWGAARIYTAETAFRCSSEFELGVVPEFLAVNRERMRCQKDWLIIRWTSNFDPFCSKIKSAIKSHRRNQTYVCTYMYVHTCMYVCAYNRVLFWNQLIRQAWVKQPLCFTEVFESIWAHCQKRRLKHENQWRGYGWSQSLEQVLKRESRWAESIAHVHTFQNRVEKRKWKFETKLKIQNRVENSKHCWKLETELKIQNILEKNIENSSKFKTQLKSETENWKPSWKVKLKIENRVEKWNWKLKTELKIQNKVEKRNWKLIILNRVEIWIWKLKIELKNEVLEILEKWQRLLSQHVWNHR
jgi:hypothetical protein